jgi:hypothetical protein
MRKTLIFSAFFLVTITILLAVVCVIIESHKETIDQIAPATEELRIKAEKKYGKLRLTEKEVAEICNQLNRELVDLNNLKWLFSFVIAFIIVVTLLIRYQFKPSVIRFDGLSLLVVSLPAFGLHSLVYEFSGGFYGGHNAAMDISIGILIGTFIIPPMLFYTAYRMNELELNLHLHKQKWISYTAIIFTALSLLLALIVGIGVLATPDLSGNIS